jgi:hypothetical protein
MMWAKNVFFVPNFKLTQRFTVKKLRLISIKTVWTNMSCFLTQVIFVTEDRRWWCSYLYKIKMFTNILNPSIIVDHRRGQTEARISKKVCKKSCIFIILVFFYTIVCGQFFHQNLCAESSKRLRTTALEYQNFFLSFALFLQCLEMVFFCRLGE